MQPLKEEPLIAYFFLSKKSLSLYTINAN